MMKSEKELTELHDKKLKEWVSKHTSILHVWREYEHGYLVSYYACLSVKYDNITFIRVFGDVPNLSVDKQVELTATIEAMIKEVT